MKRVVTLLLLLLVLASLAGVAYASYVQCAIHRDASCYSVGVVENQQNHERYEKYHCSCGDDVYVPIRGY